MALFFADSPLAGATFQSLTSQAQTALAACQAVSAAVGSGTIPADRLISLLNIAKSLQSYVQSITTKGALSDALIAYYKAQSGDQSSDVQANMDASTAAITQLISAIASEYPRGVGQTLADRTMDPSGAITFRLIPTASLPQTISAINAVVATSK